MSDAQLHGVEAFLVALLVGGYGLLFLTKRIARGSRALDLSRPVLIGFGLRVLMALVVSLTSVAATLRGGDEHQFLARAHSIADTPFTSSDFTSAFVHHLYEWVFAVQIKLFGAPELTLRVTQALIAMAGLLAIALAVHELAGPRAARIAMWLLALEPASLFFSTLLHKEANLFLAEGLVVYGGAVIWSRARLTGLVPIVAGCLIAAATRPYAGWFLVGAAVLVLLTASVRARRGNAAGALAMSLLVLALTIVATPRVISATSTDSLRTLQVSQNANAAAGNLALERVDFSSRGKIVTGLPGRVLDVVFRPYPWQVANTSQQLGVLGTMVVLALLFLLIGAIRAHRGRVMARAGPLLYCALMLLIAYSLSSGNAGTAFRYRTHVVAVGLAAMAAIRWAGQRASEPVADDARDARFGASQLAGTTSG